MGGGGWLDQLGIRLSQLSAKLKLKLSWSWAEVELKLSLAIITHFDINYYRKFLYGGSGDIVFNCNSMQVNFSFSDFKQMGGLGFPPSYICYDLFEEFDCYAKIWYVWKWLKIWYVCYIFSKNYSNRSFFEIRLTNMLSKKLL